ncbi:MAG TPA: hypothetical protein VI997_00050 [Candidatus Thermoplasmatota archaeon]|nr:hypothetical protein [Candidatus Thermoplasmatota archaeon]
MPRDQVAILACALLASALVAGCVDAPKPRGVPGTSAHPASDVMYVFLRDDSMRPKQTWVTPGTNVMFEDLQGAAHVLEIQNVDNRTIEVAANGTTVFAALELGDIRLVCRVHGDADMRGWLHVVAPRDGAS